MMTEKEKILTILKSRGIIKEDGSFDHIRFNKLITEPWIYQKVKYYNIGENSVPDELKTIDPVSVPEDIIQEDQQVIDNQLDTVDTELLEPVEKEEVQEEVQEEVLPIENVDETEDKKEITEIPVEPVSVEIDTIEDADNIESEPETKTAKKTAAKKSAKKA